MKTLISLLLIIMCSCAVEHTVTSKQANYQDTPDTTTYVDNNFSLYLNPIYDPFMFSPYWDPFYLGFGNYPYYRHGGLHRYKHQYNTHHYYNRTNIHKPRTVIRNGYRPTYTRPSYNNHPTYNNRSHYMSPRPVYRNTPSRVVTPRYNYSPSRSGSYSGRRH